MEKPFSSKAQPVFYPFAEAEKTRALLNLRDNLQWYGGTGKVVSSELQIIYRRPSSWAALVQMCNTKEVMAGCFPWKATASRVGSACLLIDPTSVKLLGKVCLCETLERVKRASKLSSVL